MESDRCERQNKIWESRHVSVLEKSEIILKYNLTERLWFRVPVFCALRANRCVLLPPLGTTTELLRFEAEFSLMEMGHEEGCIST